MECAKCRELKHVFGLKLTQYVEARASVYYGTCGSQKCR